MMVVAPPGAVTVTLGKTGRHARWSASGDDSRRARKGPTSTSWGPARAQAKSRRRRCRGRRLRGRTYRCRQQCRSVSFRRSPYNVSYVDSGSVRIFKRNFRDAPGSTVRHSQKDVRSRRDARDPLCGQRASVGHRDVETLAAGYHPWSSATVSPLRWRRSKLTIVADAPVMPIGAVALFCHPIRSGWHTVGGVGST
jgi:hypothetical protein